MKNEIKAGKTMKCVKKLMTLVTIAFAAITSQADTVAKIGDESYETLAAAIEAAESGATIKIQNGTWGADAIGTIDNTDARTKSLTIVPADGATVKFTSSIYIGYDDSTTSNAKMTVKDIAFEGASLSLVNYNQVEVENCTFNGFGVNSVGALYLSDVCCTKHKTSETYPASQVTVKNCTFDGKQSNGAAIRVRNVGNATITGNRIANVYGNGITFEANDSIDNTAAKTVTITGNTITEWNAGNASEGGRAMRLSLASSSTLQYGSSVTIENNFFTKATLGLDNPDFIKITGTGSSTVLLENNSWNDQLLATVSGNKNYYTVDGSAPAISSVITSVAQIVTGSVAKKFASLQAAIDAVAAGGSATIQMIANVAWGDAAGLCTVPVGKTITLDLNGKAIATTGAFNKAFTLITVRGSLVVEDTSTAKTGAITLNSSEDLAINAAVNIFHVDGGGRLVVESGTYGIQMPKTAYAAYVVTASNNTGSSDVIINGGSFTGTHVDGVVRLHDQKDRTGTKINVIINDGDFTLDGGSDSVVWLDVQGSDNASYVDLIIRGGTFTSTDSNPVLDIGHVGEASNFNVMLQGGAFKGTGSVLNTRMLSDTAIANIKISGGSFSGNTYYNTVKEEAVSLNNICADGCSVLANSDADYPYVVGVKIDPGSGENTLPAVEQQSEATINASAVQKVVTNETVAEKMATETVVAGVKLTTTATTGKSGMQSAVDLAKAQSKAFSNNVESTSASMVTVKVDVVVSPTKYQTTSAAFNLTPYATVTVVNTNGTDSTSTSQIVDVTNTMIDTNQNIVVSIYTGFQPTYIIHKDDNGKLIDTYAQGDFAYADGTCTLTIHHFSTLEAVSDANAVAMIGSTMYESLQAAFNAADSLDEVTITMLRSVQLESAATLGAGTNVTLQLNGTTISWGDGATEKSYGLIKNSGTLTISGGTLNAGSTVFVTCPSGSIQIADGYYTGTFPSASTATNAGPIFISGGYFSSQIPAAFCAVGYLPNDAVSGWYTVKDANVYIRNITAVQRYPWNGLVDITAEVCWGTNTTANLKVTAWDKDEGTQLTMTQVDLYENGKKRDGQVNCATGFDVPNTANTMKKLHFVWDSLEGVPSGYKKDRVGFKFTAK